MNNVIPWHPREWFIAQSWRRAAGKPEQAEPDTRGRTLEELARSEWSPEFERAMRARMIMGALRYGLLGAAGKPCYDRIASAHKRLDLYATTGNLEHLADVANMMQLEFVEGKHPNRHWAAQDGDGMHHTEVKGK